MGAADWESTLQRPATAAGGVPTRDVVVGPAGMKLTLGDTTVDIIPTPGHTPGTLSYVFPVKDQGRTVTAARAAVAYHEAGHAVISMKLGYRCLYVTIIPDGDSLGHVDEMSGTALRADIRVTPIS